MRIKVSPWSRGDAQSHMFNKEIPVPVSIFSIFTIDTNLFFLWFSELLKTGASLASTANRQHGCRNGFIKTQKPAKF